jgi:hypothetical protein
MDWLQTPADWAESNQATLWWLFFVSLAMFLLTPLVVGWLVVRMPADYFTARRRSRPAYWQRHGALGPAAMLLKNLLGIMLLVGGLVMLLVPGQGLLTIAVGLMLVDFPGKFRFERWLAMRPPVWRSINWLRKRAGRGPLERPRKEANK